MLFQIFFLTHFCGCLWHFIAKVEIDLGYGNTWLHVEQIADEKWQIKYANCLFFSVSTMITVGMMKINSHTEKFISIGILLMLSVCFAYLLNSIGKIIENMFESDRELR